MWMWDGGYNSKVAVVGTKGKWSLEFDMDVDSFWKKES